MSNINIRELSASDDLAKITQMIHAAYAKHAAAGLKFWGTHQSEADTATRFASGVGFVAERDGLYAGTITARPPQPESSLAIYRKNLTWSICQFAVAPAFNGSGLGKRLHETALRCAAEHGAKVMAIDTAAPASALIAMYAAWGYKKLGEHSWEPLTNYKSVVMSRSI